MPRLKKITEEIKKASDTTAAVVEKSFNPLAPETSSDDVGIPAGDSAISAAEVAPHPHTSVNPASKTYLGKPIIRTGLKIVNGRSYHEVVVEGETALLNEADFNRDVK